MQVELDPTDLEYSLLKQGLLPRMPYGTVLPLERLTRTIADWIAEELDHLIAATLLQPAEAAGVGAGTATTGGGMQAEGRHGAEVNVAVVVGVQLHGPEHPKRDLVWPAHFWTVGHGGGGGGGGGGGTHAAAGSAGCSSGLAFTQEDLVSAIQGGGPGRA